MAYARLLVAGLMLTAATAVHADNFEWQGDSTNWSNGQDNWINTTNLTDFFGFPNNSSDTANVDQPGNDATLTSNITVGNLNISNGGDVRNSTYVLNVTGATTLGGAGSDLFITNSPFIIDFETTDFTINNGGEFSMSNAGVQTNDRFDINVGALVYGTGLIRTAGNSVVTNDGEISATGGTLTISRPSGSTTIDPDGTNGAGFLTVSANSGLIINTPLSDSVFNGTATVNQQGTLSIADNWSLGSGGSLSFQGSSGLSFLDGGGFTNNTLVTVDTPNAGGRFVNASYQQTNGAVLDVTADSNVQFFTPTQFDIGSQINLGNSASLLFFGNASLADASTITFGSMSQWFIQAGTTTLNDPTGTFDWDNVFGNSETVIHSGAALNITVSQIDLGVGPTSNKHDGIITVKGGGSSDGQLAVDIAADEWQTAGTFNLEGGVVGGDRLSVAGFFNVQNAGTGSSAGEMYVDVHFDNGAILNIQPGNELILRRNVRFEPGSFLTAINGILHLDGTSSIFNGPDALGSGKIVNSSLTEIDDDTIWTVNEVDLDGDDELGSVTVNAGYHLTINAHITDPVDTLILLDEADLTINSPSFEWTMHGPLRAFGPVNISGSNLRVEQSGVAGGLHASSGVTTVNAGLTVLSTGRIDVGSGDTLILNGFSQFLDGSIEGSGQIIANNILILGDGTSLSPDLTINAGTLVIGDSPGIVSPYEYTQNSTGTIEIELGGASPGSGYDQMLVLTSASLSGVIDLDLIYSYIPTPYVQHTILRAGGALTGQFNQVQGVTQFELPANQGLAVTYDYGTEKVFVTAALLGDTNLDMQINIGDLTILASNFGNSSPTWSQGDFNGDGLVNIGDLTILAGNFGSSVTSPSATNVPEPASLVLLITAGLGVLRRR